MKKVLLILSLAVVQAAFGRSPQYKDKSGPCEGVNVLRLRSDFNFRAIADFFQDTRTPKRQLTLADRLTLTTSLEKYRDDEEEGFDNFTWGIGLLF